jgi:hypothetical protein
MAASALGLASTTAPPFRRRRTVGLLLAQIPADAEFFESPDVKVLGLRKKNRNSHVEASH